MPITGHFRKGVKGIFSAIDAFCTITSQFTFLINLLLYQTMRIILKRNESFVNNILKFNLKALTKLLQVINSTKFKISGNIV